MTVQILRHLQSTTDTMRAALIVGGALFVMLTSGAHAEARDGHSGAAPTRRFVTAPPHGGAVASSRIEGIVRRASGAPAVNVTVRASSGETTVTDSDGQYELVLDPTSGAGRVLVVATDVDAKGAVTFAISDAWAIAGATVVTADALVLDRAADATWDAPRGGAWTDASKWRDGHRPEAGDVVFIPPGSGVIEIDSELPVLDALVAFAPVTLRGDAELTADRACVFGRSITLDGGAIAQTALMQVDPIYPVRCTAAPTSRLTGVELTGDLRLYGGNRVVVDDGLTLYGAVHFVGPGACLEVAGDVRLEGNGVVRSTVATAPARLCFAAPTTDATLTIGRHVVVEGEHLVIGGTATGADTPNASVINLGRIVASVADGGALEVHGGLARFVNRGTLRAETLATLIVRSFRGGGIGTLELDDEAHVVLDGTYRLLRPIDLPTRSTLTLHGDWANESTISFGALSELKVVGTFTPAMLGAVDGGSGALVVEGILDNSGHTWAVPSEIRWLRLAGGTIVGGTIELPIDSVIHLMPGPVNTLDGVTVHGDLLSNEHFTSLTLRNGLHVDGTFDITRSNFIFNIDGTQTIGGACTIEHIDDQAQMRFVESAEPQTLTLDTDVVVITDGIELGSVDGPPMANVIVNHGTLIAENSADVLAVSPALGMFVNHGELRAETGGELVLRAVSGDAGRLVAMAHSDITIDGTYALTETFEIGEHADVTLRGTWTGHAPFELETDAELILDGTFVLDSTDLITAPPGAATVRVNGTMPLDGATLTVAFGSPTWVLDEGTIVGGTIQIQAPTRLRVSESPDGTLDGVTVVGTFDIIGDDDGVVIRNGLTLDGRIRLSGASSWLAFDGSQSVSGDARISNEGTGTPVVGFTSRDDDVTVVLESGIVIEGGTLDVGAVHGGNAGIGTRTLINRGRFDVTGFAQTLRVHPDVTAFLNEGVLHASGMGTLVINGLSGVLGSIELSTHGRLIIESGTYAVAAPLIVPIAGTLDLGGNWSATAPITVEVGSTFIANGTMDVATLAHLHPQGETPLVLTGVIAPGPGGATATLGAGHWSFDGVTFDGVEVTINPAAIIDLDDGHEVTFDDATMHGALEFDADDATITLRDAVEINGAWTISGRRATVCIDGVVDLSGSAVITAVPSVDASERTTFRIDGADAVFRLDEHVLIAGGGIRFEPHEDDRAAMQTLIVDGTIEATNTGTVVTLDADLDERIGSGVVRARNAGIAEIGGYTPAFELDVVAVNGGHVRWTGDFTLTDPVTVPAGTTLEFDGTWTNATTVTLETDARLRLSGSIATADIGVVGGASTGEVALRAVIDNQGDTLAVHPSLPYRLAGATINGGTIDVPEGATLRIGGASDPTRLHAVTLDGAAQCDLEPCRLDIEDGLALFGDLEVIVNDVDITFRGATTGIDGVGTVRQTGTSTALRFELDPDDAASVTTIGALIECSLLDARITSPHAAPQAFVVAGQISTAGQTRSHLVRLDGGIELTNLGALEFTGAGRVECVDLTGTLGSVVLSALSDFSVDGAFVIDAPLEVPTGARLELFGAWTNTSVLTLASGAEIIFTGEHDIADFGEIIAAPGVAASFGGTLLNEGQTFAVGGSAIEWRFDDATIIGGTVDVADGAILGVSDATFVGVTLVGTCDLDTEGGWLRIEEDLVLHGALNLVAPATTLEFLGTTTVSGAGEIRSFGDGASRVIAFDYITFDNEWVLEEGITIVGGNLDVGLPAPGFKWRVFNHGVVRAEIPGAPIRFRGALDIIRNLGTMEAVDGGTLRIDSIGLTEPAGTLPSGTWRAHGGGEIQFLDPVQIDRLAAGVRVVLDGAGSHIDAIPELVTIDIDAALELRHGAAFTAQPDGGTLTVDGALAVRETATCLIDGALDLGPTSTVLVDLLTPAAPPVTATGSVSADGTLDLAFVDGAEPTEAGLWSVASATGAWSGTFATVIHPAPIPGFEYLLVYDLHGARLIVIAP